MLVAGPGGRTESEEGELGGEKWPRNGKPRGGQMVQLEPRVPDTWQTHVRQSETRRVIQCWWALRVLIVLLCVIHIFGVKPATFEPLDPWTLEYGLCHPNGMVYLVTHPGTKSLVSCSSTSYLEPASISIILMGVIGFVDVEGL